MKQIIIVETCIGPVSIVEQKGAITNVHIGKIVPARGQCGSCVVIPASTLLRQAKKQLQEYFAGTRQQFDLPLAPEGTEFQRLAWEALLKIPYGQTISYQEQAKQIGRPGAMRAVGGANHRNPIAIIIPCHRVIGKNGNLIGYAGGLTLKQKLLFHEKVCLA